MLNLKLLSTVALLEGLPKSGLVRGQTGTIVEDLAPGVYEVEFSDPTGHAYALVAVGREQLLELHHEPNDQLA
jgi:phenolic acid decarboxylase